MDGRVVLKDEQDQEGVGLGERACYYISQQGSSNKGVSW